MRSSSKTPRHASRAIRWIGSALVNLALLSVGLCTAASGLGFLLLFAFLPLIVVYQTTGLPWWVIAASLAVGGAYAYRHRERVNDTTIAKRFRAWWHVEPPKPKEHDIVRDGPPAGYKFEIPEYLTISSLRRAMDTGSGKKVGPDRIIWREKKGGR